MLMTIPGGIMMKSSFFEDYFISPERDENIRAKKDKTNKLQTEIDVLELKTSWQLAWGYSLPVHGTTITTTL